MKYGMPTLLEFENIETNVKYAQSLGLDFIEINCNVPEFQVDAMDHIALKKLSESSGLSFTFHLDEFMSITDPNTKISDAYIQSVINSIEFAKKANIDSLTMHFINGVVFTLPEKKVYVYEKYTEYYLERLNIFRTRVTEAIGDSKVRINIENVGGFEPYMRKGIELLLESPVFGLTYDCGHNHRYDHKDWDFLQKHSARINHMHVHDCKGKNDHQPFGTGDLNIPEEIAFASRSASKAVIEVKTASALSETVKTLRSYQTSNLVK